MDMYRDSICNWQKAARELFDASRSPAYLKPVCVFDPENDPIEVFFASMTTVLENADDLYTVTEECLVTALFLTVTAAMVFVCTDKTAEEYTEYVAKLSLGANTDLHGTFISECSNMKKMIEDFMP